jgi:hypothetical protein
MNESTALVSQSAAIQPTQSGAALVAARKRVLEPYRVTNIEDNQGGRSILEFWKFGCPPAKGFSSAVKDNSIARQLAVITILKGCGTFNLQWYPHGEEIQITNAIPMNRLEDAYNDLIAAGFGSSQFLPKGVTVKEVGKPVLTAGNLKLTE